MAEPGSTDIQKQILRSLREFYPIKVDEIVLISAVQNNVKDADIEQISKDIRSQRNSGWIEESVVKAPFGKTETFRFRITSAGIGYLQGLEERGGKSGMVLATDMESRLAETYEQIKVDMMNIRNDLENKMKEQDRSTEEISKHYADLSKELAEVKELVHKLVGKTEAEKIKEEQLILRILAGDERIVYDIILNAGGEMLQKDLVARARMSNAKVSRVLDHLESRGIITKERHGATNRLRVTIKPPGN